MSVMQFQGKQMKGSGCFCFRSHEELDRELLGWLREAYRVGLQLHLSR